MSLKVYYQKKTFAHFGMREFEVSAERVEALRIADMPVSHTFLRELNTTHKNDVYYRMQKEQWTPNELSAGLPSDVSHFSMRAGDIYEDEKGRFFECLLEGWRIME